MPISSLPADSPRAGDIARHRAVLALLLFALALPLSIWLFATLEPIWARIVPLEGAAFMLAATALGAVMALAPIAVTVGFLLTLWYGVESVYLPRSQPSPLTDACIAAVGLVIWFLPMLAALAMAARALFEGRVHFVKPARDYFLATDPIAYWQGVGFLFIAAGFFGFLAWCYWRGKLRRRRTG